MKRKLSRFRPQLVRASVLAISSLFGLSVAAQNPTFSDANWSSLGGFPGVDDSVYAAVVDGSGNLYVGGSFSTAGNVSAEWVAKWNGTRWSALSSGADGHVSALAVLGNDVYVGGDFRTAGGDTVNCVAKWDGSSWSPLGSGMSGPDFGTYVSALAVSGNDLYAGGHFTTAGGIVATNIAKWNGSTWSALGSGIGGSLDSVSALA